MINRLIAKAYCHTCIQTVKQGKVKKFHSSLSKTTCLSTGYSNWKDAIVGKLRLMYLCNCLPIAIYINTLVSYTYYNSRVFI